MTDTDLSPVPITMARGDGIGPEIMDATLAILKEAGARLEIEEIQVGKAAYEAGHSSGMPPEAWDSLKRTKTILKAPITTPQGGGYKSLNVTMRKALGLYANVRPCVSYAPFVATRHPKMDCVIVRENEEDLYAGIEYRHTQEVTECIKLISRPGCERIVRYAFEYARLNHRQKVTAFLKDNIMKITDGLFHDVFREVASHYPDIEADSMIVDIGAARMADTPNWFDVVVTLNLYGDIISDIAAQVTGSVGLAGSANIGDRYAMFEAIHGSAPDIAGKGVANPSGLLLGAVMMLVHLGQAEVAERVHNGWLRTLEDGFHTADIFDRQQSKKRCGTKDFTKAVIERLGKEPETLEPVRYGKLEKRNTSGIRTTLPMRERKELVGVDVFIDLADVTVQQLADKLAPMGSEILTLQVISSRGLLLWPEGLTDTLTVDHWRARFLPVSRDVAAISPRTVIDLLARISDTGLDIIKTENLYNFNGKPGFSAAQGM